MLNLDVQQQYFDAIKIGVKTIEGRLAKDKYRLLTVGSTLSISNNDHSESVEKKIVSLRIYKNFRDAFEKEDYCRAVPDAKSVDDAVAVYEQFYSIKKQHEFSVIFIEIE